MAKAEPNAPKTKDTVSLLVAGGLAGMLTKTLTAPLERVKILLQLRSMSEITSSAPRSILGTMRSVMTNEGIISFWKGNGANCLRVVPVYALKVRKALWNFCRSFLEVWKYMRLHEHLWMLTMMLVRPLRQNQRSFHES